MQEIHSKIYSPSKSNLWIHCPLSTSFISTDESEPGLPAEYGSQTHNLGEVKIRERLGIYELDANTITSEELRKGLTLYDDQMEQTAQNYANYIVNQFEYEKKQNGAEPLIALEQYLKMEYIDESAGGTLDCGIISANGTMTIIDLKTGHNPVYTLDFDTFEVNTQLSLYALAFYKTYKDIYPIDKVRLVIYQPIINNVNEYEESLEELLNWEHNILNPAINKIKECSQECNTGEHCKYCPGRVKCRVRANEMSEVEVKDPTTLSDKEIAEILNKADAITKYMEDVKTYALNKALNGYRYIGWKLVEGRKQRVISDEKKVAEILQSNGYQPYGKAKLLTITELQKMLGKSKFNELIGEYITTPKGTLTLVPDSDKRDEVNVDNGGNIL